MGRGSGCCVAPAPAKRRLLFLCASRRRRLAQFGIAVQHTFDVCQISFQSLTKPLQFVGTLVLLICGRALCLGEDRAIGDLFTEVIERLLKCECSRFSCAHFLHPRVATGANGDLAGRLDPCESCKMVDG
jgi:hypothetical protein